MEGSAAGGRGRVQVFARVRPPSSSEGGFPSAVELNDETKSVRVHNSGELIDRVLEGQGQADLTAEIKDFAFDGVFPAASQQRDVFLAVGLPVLRECLKGFNGTILAYGQTGSGKTHSLLHRGARSDDAGLLPRLVASLFVLVAQDTASVYEIEAAAVQVYNEQIDDLLHAEHHLGGGQNLGVRDGGAVPGLTWIPCKRPDHMLEMFTRARSNVVYAETKMNKASSRSHAIFQLRISKRRRATEATQGGAHMECTQARLSVVDLAGSERVKKSGVEGAQFKEATNINKSLLAFGNVVSALAAKKQHVPLRDSKLTRILDGSIGGNCKTALLVCASPSAEHVQETVSTLEFASRAMRVEVDAKVNTCVVEVSAKALLTDLSGDVEQLGGIPLGPEMEALRKQSVEAMEQARREAQRRDKEAAESEVQQRKLEKAKAEAEDRGKKLQEEAESLRQSLQSSAAEASRLEAARRAAEESAAEWKGEAARLAREAEGAEGARRSAAEEEAGQRRRAADAERGALVWKAKAETSASEAARLGAARASAEAEAARRGAELEAAAAAAEARAEVAAGAAARAQEKVSELQAEAERLREAASQRAAAEAEAERHRAAAALEASAAEAEDLREKVAEALGRAEALGSELAARTEELQARTAALDEAAAALESLRQEAEEREIGLRAELGARLEAGSEAHAAEVAHLEVQLAQAMAEARATAQAEERASRAKSAALEEQLAREAARWAEERAQLRAEHLAAADAHREEHEARLRSGREEFEAVLAQMEQDHRAQHDELSHQLEEKQADLERMEAQWRELKDQAVREAWREGSVQQRRLAAAFKAARCISTLKESELRQQHEDLAQRFATRESREEDVTRISKQQRLLEAQQSCLQRNARAAQGLALELSNRDATDRIFGGGADRQRPALAGKKLGEGTKNYTERRRALSQSASLDLPATARRLLASTVPVC